MTDIIVEHDIAYYKVRKDGSIVFSYDLSTWMDMKRLRVTPIFQDKIMSLIYDKLYAKLIDELLETE